MNIDMQEVLKAYGQIVQEQVTKIALLMAQVATLQAPLQAGVEEQESVNG